MKNRDVRMPLPGAEGRFGDCRCRVFDLSMTGALLLLDFSPAVGSVWTFKLSSADSVLMLKVRVVRILSQSEATVKLHPKPTEFGAGVTFVDITPELRRSIPQFYAKIMSASRMQNVIGSPRGGFRGGPSRRDF